MTRMRQFAAIFLSTAALFTTAAQAQLAGTWQLYPPQGNSYQTAVQQPINADGSSNFRNTGKAVIPIKFKLSKATGPVVFRSIFSDNPGVTNNDFSFLSFTPAAPLLFKDLENLSAIYSFSDGNCHGGSLRWQVRIQVDPDTSGNIHIYYGALSDYIDCVGTPGVNESNQSGLSLLTSTDPRFDQTQLGGAWYGTYAQALAAFGEKQVVRASLIIDSGWYNAPLGDQILTPSAVTVNDNTFVPVDSAFVATCDLPPASIQVTKLSGALAGPVNEPLSVQPGDDDSQFRIVDCRYMYNLETSSLLGPGKYQVEAVIGGIPIEDGAATFDLR